MKKVIYVLILGLIVVSGLLFANREFNNKTPNKPISKPPTAAEVSQAKKRWVASPDGVLFKKWEASTAGKKVYAAEEKIRKSIRDSSQMEGVVTTLSLPKGSRLGFGIMVKINNDDYILSFGIEQKNEFEQLKSLKVDDNITIRSRSVMHAPKYAYPIVAGDYIERNGLLVYKRPQHKGGC